MAVFLACHAVHFLVCPSTDYTGAGQAAANVCPDEITQEGVCVWGGEGPGRAVSYKKKQKNLELSQVFLPHCLPTPSFCHVADLMNQVNTEKVSKQTNELECVCVSLCAQKQGNLRIQTCAWGGGRIIMQKRRAVTFFIKTLADDQRKRSYCWKARSPCTHTHTPSSIHPHTPPFQTSWESCIPLSHLLSKVTIKDAKCVYVQVCVRLYVFVCVAASEKKIWLANFIWGPQGTAQPL